MISEKIKASPSHHTYLWTLDVLIGSVARVASGSLEGTSQVGYTTLLRQDHAYEGAYFRPVMAYLIVLAQRGSRYVSQYTFSLMVPLALRTAHELLLVESFRPNSETEESLRLIQTESMPVPMTAAALSVSFKSVS